MKTYQEFLLESNVGTRWTDKEKAEFADLQYENLMEALDAMKKHKIKHWIDCGTLLGLYRDKSFIPGDSDSDTGALVEGFKPDFADDFADNLKIPGQSRSSTFFMPDEFIKIYEDEEAYTTPKGFKFQMRKKGRTKTFKGQPIMTDIFIYYPFKKDRIYSYASGYFRSKDVILQDGIKSMTVDGRTFSIPVRVEDHLETMYGKDWKEPDPHFNTKKADIYGGPLQHKDLGGKYKYNFATSKYILE
jgi:hypothetical protein